MNDELEPDCSEYIVQAEGSEELIHSENSHWHSSQELQYLFKQLQEAYCGEMALQHVTQTVMFNEVRHSATGNEAGQLACWSNAVNKLQAGYNGQLKRAFMLECVNLPGARKRPWLSVPKQSTEAMDRPTGVVTYMKPADVIRRRCKHHSERLVTPPGRCQFGVHCWQDQSFGPPTKLWLRRLRGDDVGDHSGVRFESNVR